MAKSLSHKVTKSIALNATPSIPVESRSKALKSTKEDSSDEGSTDEEMTLVMRIFKKFMKKKFHKKDDYDKKKSNHRRCYECKELGHYIADCPRLKNKEKEEKKYKEKSKDFKKRYQGRAHVGEEWKSSHEESDKEGVASLAITKTTRRLFNNISDDEEDTHFCLMARGNKILATSSSTSHPSSTSSSVKNDFDDEEKQHEAYMIKEFGKKGFKEIKKAYGEIGEKERNTR